MNNIKDEKSIIRKKQKIIRDEIFKNNPSHFVLSLFDKLFEKINFQEINIVSSFISINSEINTTELNNLIFIKNKILCLPVIEKKNSHLIFKQFKSDENFVKGHMNILEPQNKNTILNPELIFVPCLAFDHKGNRLGYGGGYYDRTFNYLNKIDHKFISVVYAYQDQKLDYIPIDKFDFKVDYVITEKNLYSFQ
ncbi:MAG: 5-formyltetrahydrofolate cyclo-ligase [Gammaproteobacteria bacterium TMED225]|nr:MAG: 5-formyltetrahydrofolate cyclo-ligase [Gammaproteobacteria bacterium TMED225]